MHSVFLPFVFTATAFGVAATQGQVPASHFYNYSAWTCNSYALHDGYWPMVWSSESTQFLPNANCHGLPLLILNEPEQDDQADDTPTQGAALLHEWAGWPGPLYCCGNLTHDRGWKWFNDMLAVYEADYGALPPLTGIHLHAYTVGSYDISRLQRWRQLADSHGWQIVVTEAGPYPYSLTRQQIADKVPVLLPVLLKELQPTHVFWFALSVDGVLGEWEKMALVDSTGKQTPVGAAWERYTVPPH